MAVGYVFLITVLISTVISTSSSTAECPVALPQHTSLKCRVQRKVELTKNRKIYNISSTPNYNDPKRNKDVLIAPLWDTDKNTAYVVGQQDPLEKLWMGNYYPILTTNVKIRNAYENLMSDDWIREYTKITDWRKLLVFYYMYYFYFRESKMIRSNPRNLIIEKWQDDRIFAEQQIAGINPYAVKRVTSKPCPRKWILVGNNCYKLFFANPYSNFQEARAICKAYSSNLAILSNSIEAAKVNEEFRSATDDDEVSVYVDGADGMWSDGSLVKDATNQPNKFKKCLTARMTPSGIKFTYSYCLYSVRRIASLCQKSANYDGVKISALKPFLNPSFNWRKAFESKLKSTLLTHSNKLLDAIQDGRVFVVEFPELRGIRSSPDTDEVHNDGRTMHPLASPIAFFVSNPDINGGEFLPVAIQTNSTRNSPVYTPADGDDWKIAKILVQSAALATTEILEHLLHSHFLNDPICASYKRNIPPQHPLGQLLRQHCLGTLSTSKVAEDILLPAKGKVDKIFTVGFQGQLDILNNGFNAWSYKMNDPNYRLKKAGVLDKKMLPFYPFRDDGLEVYKFIGEFVRDYVYLYYKSDADVVQDLEIQGWANELALGAFGTANSGKGKIRDFPKSFTTRALLIDTLQKFIWSSSCHHAAANFPVIDYATFVPNMPGKFYDVKNVTGFDLRRFPTKRQSSRQVEVTFNLGLLHYDSLLDYAKKLKDSKATALVTKYKIRIEILQIKLEARNNANVAKGHLSYNYLHPANIPNSIST